ncbi:MAG: bifunctional DNA-formamidopyrimidine glycosylase/DNA-(apurinic or apyrimidinic site) lyase, partial [Myxococcota bacterium]|nr:bifunctional DNA-formamidopyrimidine glycosylase/DNA-(apurinic or apyrimidinic site) lyase [Myxococcota bacterium]
MPELPEVHFTQRKLNDWLVGQAISSVWCEAGRPLVRTEPRALKAALQGHIVKEVLRRGKQLVWRTNTDTVIMVHLGMTGKWLRLEPGAPMRKWTRIQLDLGSSDRLVYVDPRRLGRIEVVQASDWEMHPSWAGLGADALTICDTPSGLMEVLRTTKASIKSALLQQKRVAGVGNIYAAEGLYLAGVHPEARACDLALSDYTRLAAGLKQALLESIEREIGDEIDYVTAGRADNPFLVYRRSGEQCRRCVKATIVRINQDGRSTFFCPNCQP